MKADEVVQVVRQSSKLIKPVGKLTRKTHTLILIPSQRPTILGLVFDLLEGIVLVSERLVRNLREQLSYLFHKHRPSEKESARLTGMITSVSFALGPVARLRIRGL